MWGISKAGVEVPGAAPIVRPGRPEALEEEVNGDVDWEALLPKRSRCEHDAALREEKPHSGVAREAPLLMRANPFIFWCNNKSLRKIYFLWLFLRQNCAKHALQRPIRSAAGVGQGVRRCPPSPGARHAYPNCVCVVCVMCVVCVGDCWFISQFTEVKTR